MAGRHRGQFREQVKSEKDMELEPYTAVVDQVPSLCPHCDAKITSSIIDRDGKIYQSSRCERHGVTESLLFSNSALYRRLDAWNQLLFPSLDGTAPSPEAVGNPEHHPLSSNPPTLGVIDLTNSCNYKCPLCFAGNGDLGHSYFLDVGTVRKMLEVLLTQSATPCRNVQFSGGEPTLHPEFPQILMMARGMGFTHIQVATNGSRFVNPDYVSQCEEMGLHTLYLQFDAMNDDAYMKLRGKRLVEGKIRVVRNVAKTNMRIVLVPTIAASINVDQIGPIFNFALEYSRHITGISIQPAAFIGRARIGTREENPFNLADLAMEFSKQTGLTRFPDDWLPLNAVSMITQGVGRIRGEALPSPACDAHCSLGTYFYIDEKNKPFCINAFLDLDRFLKFIGKLAPKSPGDGLRQKISRLRELEALAGCFHKGQAPKGLTFRRLLRSLDGWEDKSCGRAPEWFKEGFNGMFVAGMHFMDSHNYNFRRVRRCIVQYVTTDGNMIPFCSYNAGPRFRAAEELARQSGSVSKGTGVN
jgi:uncharacterized radical SAM superfamily Fe-S cluster-containing enzyme